MIGDSACLHEAKNLISPWQVFCIFILYIVLECGGPAGSSKGYIPATPDHGDKKWRQSSSTATVSSSGSGGRNSQESLRSSTLPLSSRFDSAGESSSDSPWPSNSSSVDVAAFRAANRERASGGSPNRYDSSLPWDVASWAAAGGGIGGSSNAVPLMHPILEGQPNTVGASGKASAAAAGGDGAGDAGRVTNPVVDPSFASPALQGAVGPVGFIESNPRSPAPAGSFAFGALPMQNAAEVESRAASESQTQTGSVNRPNGVPRLDSQPAQPSTDTTAARVGQHGQQAGTDAVRGKGVESGRVTSLPVPFQGQPPSGGLASQAKAARLPLAEQAAEGQLSTRGPGQTNRSDMNPDVAGHSLVRPVSLDFWGAGSTAAAAGRASIAGGPAVEGRQQEAMPSFLGTEESQPLAAPIGSIGGRSGAKRPAKRKTVPGKEPSVAALSKTDPAEKENSTAEQDTEEEDGSPRSRAMSAFLARRRASSPSSTVRSVCRPKQRLPTIELPAPESAALAVQPRIWNADLAEASPPRVRFSKQI